tara:strand:+ start:342 stop:566 length:225 start_codon:yes stop_codon:yes gene_type:complete
MTKDEAKAMSNDLKNSRRRSERRLMQIKAELRMIQRIASASPSTSFGVASKCDTIGSCVDELVRELRFQGRVGE